MDRIAPVGKTSDKVIMSVAVVGPFLGLLTAILLLWQHGWMGWLYLGMLLVGWVLTGLGITVGFHRLLTHHSFQTFRPVRAAWMALGALSVEGSPLVWCAVHRKHHQKSDQPGDPHSPHLHGSGRVNFLRGFWFAHTGWLFTGHWSYPEMQRQIPDLLEDRLLVWTDRFYYLWVLLSLFIPTAIGGVVTMSWSGAGLGFLWGGLARIFVTHHVTWSVNSVSHLFGFRTYRTPDHSMNNPVVGLLALGEGWHNNHHAFPTSARHGLEWWQFDVSWLIIRGMELLGLAWDVRLPTASSLAAKRISATEVEPR